MTNRCKVEVYTSGNYTPKLLAEIIDKITCCTCDISINDINDANNLEKVKLLKIDTFPSITVNGKLVRDRLQFNCCQKNTECCLHEE